MNQTVYEINKSYHYTQININSKEKEYLIYFDLLKIILHTTELILFYCLLFSLVKSTDN